MQWHSELLGVCTLCPSRSFLIDNQLSFFSLTAWGRVTPKSGSSLDKVKAGRLFGTKPLPVLYSTVLWIGIVSVILIGFDHFHIGKYIWNVFSYMKMSTACPSLNVLVNDTISFYCINFQISIFAIPDSHNEYLGYRDKTFQSCKTAELVRWGHFNINIPSKLHDDSL